jgi:hypothetical protein
MEDTGGPRLSERAARLAPNHRARTMAPPNRAYSLACVTLKVIASL